MAALDWEYSCAWHQRIQCILQDYDSGRVNTGEQKNTAIGKHNNAYQ